VVTREEGVRQQILNKRRNIMIILSVASSSNGRKHNPLSKWSRNWILMQRLVCLHMQAVDLACPDGLDPAVPGEV
jgi:hypothetical protein